MQINSRNWLFSELFARQCLIDLISQLEAEHLSLLGAIFQTKYTLTTKRYPKMSRLSSKMS